MNTQTDKLFLYLFVVPEILSIYSNHCLLQNQNMVTKLAFKLSLLTFLLRFCNGFNVVGYMPEWRHEGADFDRLCKHLTHLIFFSLEMSSRGNHNIHRNIVNVAFSNSR